MENMLRTNELSGARFYNIIKSQIVKETSVDVISSVFRSVLPKLIKNQMPLKMYEQCHHEIFEMILDKILTPGIIKDNAASHVLIGCMLNSARNEDHYELLVDWFNTGKLTNTLGT